MSGQLASQFAMLELDDEDDETDEKPFPRQFYGDDGKMFWRYFDFENAHKMDQDWENEVVSIDERQKEVFNKDGYLDRPTYKSKDGNPRKDINYNRWRLFEGTNDPEELRRLADNTWVIESSLNSLDFNEPDDSYVDLPPLDNRIDEPLEKLYPKGARLLIKESRRHGGTEWKEGRPLGPDPTRQDALRKPVGWVPPQQRVWRRGLGGDITDPVHKHWFHGDLDVPLPKDFVEPENSWSRDRHRVVLMKSVVSETNAQSHIFPVQSEENLLNLHWFIANYTRYQDSGEFW